MVIVAPLLKTFVILYYIHVLYPQVMPYHYRG